MLLAGSQKLGRLGQAWGVGDVDSDGREEVVVSLSDLGGEFDCVWTSESSYSWGLMHPGTGGLGLISLP